MTKNEQGVINYYKQSSRLVVWICSKFTRNEIEVIIKELTEILNNRNPDVKPKDDFKEKHPNYRNFFVDPNPRLTEPKNHSKYGLERSAR